MGDGRTRYARNGDISIAYQARGNADRDLVLVPSWISQIEHMWTEPRLRRMQTRMLPFTRLITFDRRGSGMSDRVDHGTLEDQIDDVRAVMSAAGAERVALWAETEGSAMACLFAATHPELVSHLILFMPLPRVLRADDYDWASDPVARDALIDVFEANWGTGRSITELAPSLAGDPVFHEWAGTLERLSHSPGEVRPALEMMGRTDIRHVLPSVRVPTLVIARTGNTAISIRHAEYVAETIPGARMARLEGDDTLLFAGDTDPVVDAMEEFMTGARSAPEPERVLATVLFTDIVDSTARAAEMGDRRWRELLDDHHAMVRGSLREHGGREVKTLGDGFLAIFDGPARAVRCALSIVEASGASGLPLRAGAHTGECAISDTDVTGIAVHIASRVLARAGAGEVVVSRTITDLVAGSQLEFSSKGAHELKGLPGSWELFTAAA
jgi:class 3 adenylate cyclase